MSKDLFFDSMKNYIENNNNKGKVIKSVPATKEEQKMWSEMSKKIDEALNIIKYLLPEREKFWAKINMRLDSFGETLSYNKENNEIEFIENNIK